MPAMDVRPGFDPTLVGKRAECDGGGMVPGGRYATRQEFTGSLTGEYREALPQLLAIPTGVKGEEPHRQP